MMKLRKLFLPAVLVLFGLASNASALDKIAEEIKQGCSTEIEEYCSQVSLGQGRLLACFYAHEDKLSGRCAHTLYQASAQLNQAIVALNYVGEQCRDDILSHCANVEMGEGRVAQCLKSNSAKVSAGCKQAMSDVLK